MLDFQQKCKAAYRNDKQYCQNKSFNCLYLRSIYNFKV